MSARTVRNEIAKFLASTTTEIICLRGGWGVGKSYAWVHWLTEARDKRNLAMKRYSEVSLFGIANLNELKFAVSQNTKHRSLIGRKMDWRVMLINPLVHIANAYRWVANRLAVNPYVGQYVGGIDPLAIPFMNVNNTLICFDDIERRGDNLALRDVMGLALHLKEKRNCKIVMILNEDAETKNRDQLNLYHEKTIDKWMSFNPTSKESLEIAISPERRLVKTYERMEYTLLRMRLSNIRIIRRIDALLEDLYPVIKDSHSSIIEEVIRIVVLTVWMLFEAKIDDPFDALHERAQAITPKHEPAIKKPLETVEKRVTNKLYLFNPVELSSLTYLIIEGVKQGYFDEYAIREAAMQKSRDAKCIDAEAEVMSAINKVTSSFDDNEEEVMGNLVKVALANAVDMRRGCLQLTIEFLREMDKQEEATKIIEACRQAHQSDSTYFNEGQTQHVDPEIETLFKGHIFTGRVRQNLTELVSEAASKPKLSAVDLEMIDTKTEDEFYAMFKNPQPYSLPEVISWLYNLSVPPELIPMYEAIKTRADSAMRRIGKESSLNSRRVRHYRGIVD